MTGKKWGDKLNANSAIARLRNVQTRSISAENPDGSKGGGARSIDGRGAHYARELGTGWKVSPNVSIGGGETIDVATIDGPGLITHIWMTLHYNFWRKCILRIYWDDCDEPAVEVPVGDFFCNGWGSFAQVSSEMIATNPFGGFNSYWPMPFRKNARISMENTSRDPVTLYYQVTYEVGDEELEISVPDLGYLHAQWFRSNPLAEGETHPILHGITGKGHYVGTYMTWGSNSNGWWGEGELKMYMDGDSDYPTICGTGTEDYFGGAWDFDIPGRGYTTYNTPYLGVPQVIKPDGLYVSQLRFGMYRWHILDPVYFDEYLKVDIQALGWKSEDRYKLLRDDISSMAVFYLDRTKTARPPVPTPDMMEVHTGTGAQPEL